MKTIRLFTLFFLTAALLLCLAGAAGAEEDLPVFHPEDIVWTKTADGDLFVSIFNAGNLIDTDSWELRAWIPNCLGCLPELNQVVTSGTDPESSESRLGAFPLYTLDQIQDMAATALKGYTLTPEQKEFYGLD